MILISVGANLPGPDGSPPVDTCIAAVKAVAAIPDLRLTAVSEWYRTTAIPKSTQPDYCNGIIRLDGQMGPLALMEALQAIETRFGRVPGVPNAARPLDLDLIDLNGMIRAVPAPVLPHPRAHLRAFVLRPILDVAPGWRHPTLRMGVSALLAELPPQGIVPWFQG
jgi:2-amino-4-hydroxy-6-hydroxymethyldihydropteridine diphosphokinase